MARRWLIAAVLLLTLGGCGDEPETEPATVPVPATGTASPAGPTTVAGRTTVAASAGTTARTADRARGGGTAGFVTVVQRDLPGLAVDRRDDEIATLGRQACAALAEGRPAGAVVAEVRAIGADRATGRTLVGLAIDTVCPEQDRRAREF
ncbi:hypothetical protein GCM10020358_28220 [Amorphoplanes nipponensis]|uniref:DUF732 domain-containing protein n=1 Tax=Actinoplanes nipponensis TaxID=135950 RepID=A0A919JFR4_9ACTN|nr:DUF732 domain-containing protein [Actinoplanes nipponensis]GIE48495.1 hypothetical protein Ani05nite_20290 [Actinoplanes nipponensis]